MQTVIRFKDHLYYIPALAITTVASSNQPAGGAIKIVSSSVSDTQLITVWGTRTNLGSFLYYETITLTGTSVVTSATTDWQTIVGAYLGKYNGVASSIAVGNITIENAALATIYTIAAGKWSIGAPTFLLPGQNIELENISGNTWINTINTPNTDVSLPVATVASATGAALYMTGQTSKEIKTRNFVSLVSDGTGSSAQITVIEG